MPGLPGGYRSSARASGRALALVVALGLAASAVQGQARTDSAGVGEIEYAAPSPCPDRGFFEARLRARVSRDLSEALVGMRLRVTIEPRANAVRGRIELVALGKGTAHARTSSRQIEAASCLEVVEGLALIAALSIATPNARDAAPGDDPAYASPPAKATQASPQRDRVGDSPAEPIAGATAASAAGKPARSDGRAPEDTPRAGEEAKSGERAPAEPEPDARPGPESPAMKLSLYAGVLAFHGLAPQLQPGLQLGLELRVLHSDGLDWVVRLAGRFAFEQELRAIAGLATFGFLGAAVSLCAVSPVAGGHASVDACAVVEPGVLSAAGAATQNAEGYHRTWLALGGGVGVAWHPWRALGLRAAGELLAPIRRDRYRLGRELIHQVPPAGGRLVLSLIVGLS